MKHTWSSNGVHIYDDIYEYNCVACGARVTTIKEEPGSEDFYSHNISEDCNEALFQVIHEEYYPFKKTQ